jgi:hypothetical protein
VPRVASSHSCAPEGEYTVEVKKGPMFTSVPEAEFQVNAKIVTYNMDRGIQLICRACKIEMDTTKNVITVVTNTI